MMGNMIQNAATFIVPGVCLMLALWAALDDLESYRCGQVAEFYKILTEEAPEMLVDPVKS